MSLPCPVLVLSTSFGFPAPGDAKSTPETNRDDTKLVRNIDMFLTIEPNRVLYEQGLELNQTQHNPNFVHYNTQQQYGQPQYGQPQYGQPQYGQPPQFDPHRQSYQTGSSPAFSALTPASDGKIPFEGPPPTGTEKAPGDEHVNLRIGKRKLWLILGAVAVVLVLGLSLGLGLGLGLSQSGSGSSR